MVALADTASSKATEITVHVPNVWILGVVALMLCFILFALWSIERAINRAEDAIVTLNDNYVKAEEARMKRGL